MIVDKLPTTPEPAEIGCASGCGRKATPADLSLKGWSLLPISGRYRCPQCWRDLQRVNAPAPAEGSTP